MFNKQLKNVRAAGLKEHMRSACDGKGLDEITKERSGPRQIFGKHYLYREEDEAGETDVEQREE